MAILTKRSKGTLGVKAGKALVKNPGLVTLGAQAAAPVGKLSVKAARPFVKRRARRQASSAA